MSDEERRQLEAADRQEIDPRTIRISQESIEWMNDTIINNINAAVGEDDILWVGGDAFWGTSRDSAECFRRAKQLRDRIKCRTLNLIWGNHDEEWTAPCFANVMDQTAIMVDGQRIFLNHFPMRAWDKSHRGAWMLYGHVHGLFYEEDEKGMSDEYRQSYFEDIRRVVLEHQGSSVCPAVAVAESIARALLEGPIMDRQRCLLTLDIGVDSHDFRPWSMDEMRTVFAARMSRWEAQHRREAQARPGSTRKLPGEV